MSSRYRAATAALAAILWGRGRATAQPTPTPVRDIHLIQHVVVIMQENRSFDHYFGTYPGADGIPMDNGTPSVCVTDPMRSICVKPYHDPANVNGGGPHRALNAAADIDGGKMDGFIDQNEKSARLCVDPTNPNCSKSTTPG